MYSYPYSARGYAPAQKQDGVFCIDDPQAPIDIIECGGRKNWGGDKIKTPTLTLDNIKMGGWKFWKIMLNRFVLV